MGQSLQQIKMLNLTDDDFKLLIDGLDSLPEKGMAGELMGDMLFGLLVKDGDEEAKAKFDSDRKRKQYERESKASQQKEDIKILQGKLLMLKRYLQENNLLNEAYDIINIPSR